MKLGIMVMGNVACGKTTAAKSLMEYFKSIGERAYLISETNGNMRDRLDSIDLKMFKYNHTENAPEILIVDGALLTVYDRDTILHGDNADEERVWVCIYMDRNPQVTKQFNEAKGHKRYTDNWIRKYHFRDQRPIHDEGFELIERVGGTDYLDIDRLISNMNRLVGTNFLVANADSQDEAAADDAVEAEAAEVENEAE